MSGDFRIINLDLLTNFFEGRDPETGKLFSDHKKADTFVQNYERHPYTSSTAKKITTDAHIPDFSLSLVTCIEDRYNGVDRLFGNVGDTMASWLSEHTAWNEKFGSNFVPKFCVSRDDLFEKNDTIGLNVHSLWNDKSVCTTTLLKNFTFDLIEFVYSCDYYHRIPSQSDRIKKLQDLIKKSFIHVCGRCALNIGCVVNTNESHYYTTQDNSRDVVMVISESEVEEMLLQNYTVNLTKDLDMFERDITRNISVTYARALEMSDFNKHVNDPIKAYDCLHKFMRNVDHLENNEKFILLRRRGRALDRIMFRRDNFNHNVFRFAMITEEKDGYIAEKTNEKGPYSPAPQLTGCYMAFDPEFIRDFHVFMVRNGIDLKTSTVIDHAKELKYFFENELTVKHINNQGFSVNNHVVHIATDMKGTHLCDKLGIDSSKLTIKMHKSPINAKHFCPCCAEALSSKIIPSILEFFDGNKDFVTENRHKLKIDKDILSIFIDGVDNGSRSLPLDFLDGDADESNYTTDVPVKEVSEIQGDLFKKGKRDDGVDNGAIEEQNKKVAPTASDFTKGLDMDDKSTHDEFEEEQLNNLVEDIAFIHNLCKYNGLDINIGETIEIVDRQSDSGVELGSEDDLKKLILAFLTKVRGREMTDEEKTKLIASLNKDNVFAYIDKDNNTVYHVHDMSTHETERREFGKIRKRLI